MISIIIYLYIILANAACINFCDYNKMETSEMIKAAQKELAAAFKRFDVDQSGFLEKNEFGQLIRRIAMAFNVEEPTFTDIDNLVAAIDTNGDGRITQA